MNRVDPERNKDRTIHILFVDDDTSLLGITRLLLERMGYIVTSANNGHKAITLVEEYHDVFDVVITDYAMPGMNGIEFALLARKYLEDTPIILYSGRIDLIDEQHIAEAGITEVVEKPCKVRDLDIIIKRMIADKGVATPNKLQSCT